MKAILNVYEQVSGQQMNFQKFEVFFSKNVAKEDHDSIAQSLVNACIGTCL